MAAWATGAWAADAWIGTAWATVTSSVTIDTHDGFDDVKRQKDEENRKFKEKKEKLRSDLIKAFDKTFGIPLPEETEPAEMVQAIEENVRQLSKSDISEIEKRVIEKLVSDYRKYEQEKAIYDREEEWDMDAILAIAHLVH